MDLNLLRTITNYTQKGRVEIDFSFSVGSSGVPTLLTEGGYSLGVYKIDRQSQGKFRAHLGRSEGAYDSYSVFFNAPTTIIYSGTPTVYSQALCSASLTSYPNYVDFQFVGPSIAEGETKPIITHVARDPDEGSIVLATIILKLGVAR